MHYNNIVVVMFVFCCIFLFSPCEHLCSQVWAFLLTAWEIVSTKVFRFWKTDDTHFTLHLYTFLTYSTDFQILRMVYGSI